jgi:hypothetical protein
MQSCAMVNLIQLWQFLIGVHHLIIVVIICKRTTQTIFFSFIFLFNSWWSSTKPQTGRHLSRPILYCSHWVF